MDGYKKNNSGECANGLYFPGSNLPFVEEISSSVIEKTLENLLWQNEFLDYFKKCKSS